jgi:hypothetical protein
MATLKHLLQKQCTQDTLASCHSPRDFVAQLETVVKAIETLLASMEDKDNSFSPTFRHDYETLVGRMLSRCGRSSNEGLLKHPPPYTAMTINLAGLRLTLPTGTERRVVQTAPGLDGRSGSAAQRDADKGASVSVTGALLEAAIGGTALTLDTLINGDLASTLIVRVRGAGARVLAHRADGQPDEYTILTSVCAGNSLALWATHSYVVKDATLAGASVGGHAARFRYVNVVSSESAPLQKAAKVGPPIRFVIQQGSPQLANQAEFLAQQDESMPRLGFVGAGTSLALGERELFGVISAKFLSPDQVWPADSFRCDEPVASPWALHYQLDLDSVSLDEEQADAGADAVGGDVQLDISDGAEGESEGEESDYRTEQDGQISIAGSSRPSSAATPVSALPDARGRRFSLDSASVASLRSGLSRPFLLRPTLVTARAAATPSSEHMLPINEQSAQKVNSSSSSMEVDTFTPLMTVPDLSSRVDPRVNLTTSLAMSSIPTGVASHPVAPLASAPQAGTLRESPRLASAVAALKQDPVSSSRERLDSGSSFRSARSYRSSPTSSSISAITPLDDGETGVAADVSRLEQDSEYPAISTSAFPRHLSAPAASLLPFRQSSLRQTSIKQKRVSLQSMRPERATTTEEALPSGTMKTGVGLRAGPARASFSMRPNSLMSLPVVGPDGSVISAPTRSNQQQFPLRSRSQSHSQSQAHPRPLSPAQPDATLSSPDVERPSTSKAQASFLREQTSYTFARQQSPLVAPAQRPAADPNVHTDMRRPPGRDRDLHPQAPAPAPAPASTPTTTTPTAAAAAASAAASLLPVVFRDGVGSDYPIPCFVFGEGVDYFGPAPTIHDDDVEESRTRPRRNDKPWLTLTVRAPAIDVFVAKRVLSAVDLFTSEATAGSLVSGAAPHVSPAPQTGLSAAASIPESSQEDTGVEGPAPTQVADNDKARELRRCANGLIKEWHSRHAQKENSAVRIMRVCVWAPVIRLRVLQGGSIPEALRPSARDRPRGISLLAFDIEGGVAAVVVEEEATRSWTATGDVRAEALNCCLSAGTAPPEDVLPIAPGRPSGALPAVLADFGLTQPNVLARSFLVGTRATVSATLTTGDVFARISSSAAAVAAGAVSSWHTTVLEFLRRRRDMAVAQGFFRKRHPPKIEALLRVVFSRAFFIEELVPKAETRPYFRDTLWPLLKNNDWRLLMLFRQLLDDEILNQGSDAVWESAHASLRDDMNLQVPLWFLRGAPDAQLTASGLLRRMLPSGPAVPMLSIDAELVIPTVSVAGILDSRDEEIVSVSNVLLALHAEQQAHRWDFKASVGVGDVTLSAQALGPRFALAFVRAISTYPVPGRPRATIAPVPTLLVPPAAMGPSVDLSASFDGRSLRRSSSVLPGRGLVSFVEAIDLNASQEKPAVSLLSPFDMPATSRLRTGRSPAQRSSTTANAAAAAAAVVAIDGNGLNESFDSRVSFDGDARSGVALSPPPLLSPAMSVPNLPSWTTHSPTRRSGDSSLGASGPALGSLHLGAIAGHDAFTPTPLHLSGHPPHHHQSPFVQPPPTIVVGCALVTFKTITVVSSGSRSGTISVVLSNVATAVRMAEAPTALRQAQSEGTPMSRAGHAVAAATPQTITQVTMQLPEISLSLYTRPMLSPASAKDVSIIVSDVQADLIVGLAGNPPKVLCSVAGVRVDVPVPLAVLADFAVRYRRDHRFIIEEASMARAASLHSYPPPTQGQSLTPSPCSQLVAVVRGVSVSGSIVRNLGVAVDLGPTRVMAGPTSVFLDAKPRELAIFSQVGKEMSVYCCCLCGMSNCVAG